MRGGGAVWPLFSWPNCLGGVGVGGCTSPPPQAATGWPALSRGPRVAESGRFLNTDFATNVLLWGYLCTVTSVDEEGGQPSVRLCYAETTFRRLRHRNMSGSPVGEKEGQPPHPPLRPPPPQVHPPPQVMYWNGRTPQEEGVTAPGRAHFFSFRFLGSVAFSSRESPTQPNPPPPSLPRSSPSNV